MSEIKKKRAPKNHVTDVNGNFILKEDAIKIGTKYYHKMNVIKIDGEYYEKDNTIVKCALTGKLLKIGVNTAVITNHKLEVVYVDYRLVNTHIALPITKNTLDALLSEKNINVENFYESLSIAALGRIKTGNYLFDAFGLYNLINYMRSLDNNATASTSSRVNPNINYTVYYLKFYSIEEALKCGFIPFFEATNQIRFIHKKDAEFFKMLSKELYLKYNSYLGAGVNNFQFTPSTKLAIINTGIFKENEVSSLNRLYGVESKTFFRTGGLPYSFGVEIETAAGNIKSINNELNLSCVRDGSISAGEYVTGVLKGDAGVKHFKTISDRLYYNTSVNNQCGTHCHIGGLNLNKEFFIYAYLLGLKVQGNLFDKFLPIDRRDNRYCRKYTKYTPTSYKPKIIYNQLYKAIVEKVSNEQLDSISTYFGSALFYDFKNIYSQYSKEDYQMYIDEMYKIFYMLMSQGKKLSSSNNKNFQHPGGRYAGGSGNSINYRYYWLNFISAAFNQRDNKNAYTIEFRCFGGTTNFYSNYAWLLICMAFCSYVENNKSDIVNKEVITLQDIIEFAYGKANNKFLYNTLTDYIAYRESNEFESEIETFPIKPVHKMIEESDINGESSFNYRPIEMALESSIEADEAKYNPNNISAISQLINFYHLNLKK